MFNVHRNVIQIMDENGFLMSVFSVCFLVFFFLFLSFFLNYRHFYSSYSTKIIPKTVTDPS